MGSSVWVTESNRTEHARVYAHLGDTGGQRPAEEPAGWVLGSPSPSRGCAPGRVVWLGPQSLHLPQHCAANRSRFYHVGQRVRRVFPGSA